MVRVFDWLVLLGRSQASKDAEILVLRRQVAARRSSSQPTGDTGNFAGLTSPSGDPEVDVLAPAGPAEDKPGDPRPAAASGGRAARQVHDGRGIHTELGVMRSSVITGKPLSSRAESAIRALALHVAQVAMRYDLVGADDSVC